MSSDRFEALMAVLHVVDPSTEDENDKLRKVSSFIEHFKNECKALYQPFQRVAVDERMVKSKLNGESNYGWLQTVPMATHVILMSMLAVELDKNHQLMALDMTL